MNTDSVGGAAIVGVGYDEDFDREWKKSLRNAPPVKSRKTRLLDMMAGWLKYASADEFPDDPNVGDEIASLYQMAGQIPFDQMTGDEADDAIRDFLTERVLRVISCDLVRA